MKIQDLDIKSIKAYSKNPRKNDAAVDAVAASIREFGWKQPLVIDPSTMEIVAGHTRYKAAKKLGCKTVPCVMADDLTAEQIKAYRLADNKTAELAEWDFDLLGDELGDIEDIDMAEFGFDLSAISDDDEVTEDQVPELDEENETIVKPGDIWQLGEHRLMCGDSTDKEAVEKLMDGAEADLLLTDPPYNIDHDTKEKSLIGIRPNARLENELKCGIENDLMGDAEFSRFLITAFENSLCAMRPGAAFYVWHAEWERQNFERALSEVGLPIKQSLIWAKNHFSLCRQDYQWKHEPCLYGWKEGAAHYFKDSRTETTVIEDAPDINKMSKEQLKEYVKELLKNEPASTVIHEDKPLRNEDHPTMKPVKLMAYLIRNSSRKGEIVLDLFGGSGSTLIACEQVGRQCYMMELDPRYCDVIVKRWEKLTGQTAVKL